MKNLVAICFNVNLSLLGTTIPNDMMCVCTHVYMYTINMIFICFVDLINSISLVWQLLTMLVLCVQHLTQLIGLKRVTDGLKE